MEETTRRTFFSVVPAAITSLVLWGRKKDEVAPQDLRGTLECAEICAENFLKERNYWRERCLDAEKDLCAAEIDLECLGVERVANTHPDCMTIGNPDTDILSGKTKSFPNVSKMLNSLKRPWSRKETE